MRIIDADALKDNMFHYAASEMVWDRGDIEHKINEMPTIEAISVKWLRSKREELLTKNWEIVDSIDNVLQFWVSEKE